MRNRLNGYRSRRILIPLLLLTAMFSPLIESLEARETHVAVLGLENLNRDPRYDYLEGMILGVLMYDLTRVDDIVLVERARLDRIFEEQELKLSGLLNNVDTAKQVGQMAGADALIEGSYAFLGGDMMINLSLMTVDEGKTIPLSVRGQTENTVHNLAEQIVEALLGRSVILAGEEGERSLLSLSDEEPGSIEFYCNFIQGEIYVDDEFYGYTPGGTTPTILEDLSPGEHTVRVEAGNDFGVIDWPEVVFHDWEERVVVKAGRKSILRASIFHFNDQLYSAKKLYGGRWRLESGAEEEISVEEDASYTDRSGRTVPVTLMLNAELKENRPIVHLEVTAGRTSRSWDFDPSEETIEMEEMIGPVELDFEQHWYSNRYWQIEIRLDRSDINQGMHRE